MGVKGRPSDWETNEDFLEAYAEAGESIGKALIHDPDKEPYFWSLLGGIGLWPRWYLKAFQAKYKQEHRSEYNVAKNMRYKRRKAKERRLVECDHTREAANAAMLTPNSKKAGKDASTPNERP